MGTQKIQLGLVENILDYLLEAAEHAEKDSPRDWKYALLHTVAAIELLVKARLQEEHWSLVFADVDKAAKGALKTGDFISVDFKAAIRRLADIAGVGLEQTTQRKLERLRKHRNKIQHYALNVDRAIVLPIIAFGYNFALNFIRDELQEVDTADVNELMLEAAQRLAGFDEFIETRMVQVNQKLKEANGIIECPKCWQEAMVLGEDNPHCLFCGAESAPKDLAWELSVEGEPEICPECGGVCVQLIAGACDATTWQCLSCGVSGDYERCSRCDQLINGEPLPGDLCRNCWQYILAKND